MELPGGYWRLVLHEDEMGCSLDQLTASRALHLLRWKYPEVFEQDQRYLMLASRDILRPQELLQPHMVRNEEMTLEMGHAIHYPGEFYPYPMPRPPPEQDQNEDDRVPPLVEPALEQAHRDPVLQPQLGDDQNGMCILEEIAYRPTVAQVFGDPPLGANRAYGLPDPSELVETYS